MGFLFYGILNDLYTKVKGVFWRRPLLDKTTSETSPNEFGERSTWIELTSERRSQSEVVEGYIATIDAQPPLNAPSTSHRNQPV